MRTHVAARKTRVCRRVVDDQRYDGWRIRTVATRGNGVLVPQGQVDKIKISDGRRGRAVVLIGFRHEFFYYQFECIFVDIIHLSRVKHLHTTR